MPQLARVEGAIGGAARQQAERVGYVNLDVRVVMHENGHNLGAVQLSAPNDSGRWHCNDGLDIMCYVDGGPQQCTTGGFLCENTCFDLMHYDCGHNDYFRPNPTAGSYLDTHWNIAETYVRYLTGGGAGNQAPTMVSLSCSPNPSNVGQSVNCMFSANDDSSGVHYTLDWGDGSGTTRAPASGTVAPGTTQSTSHTYTSANTYTISVTATDNDASPLTSSARTTAQVVVAPPCSLARTGNLLLGLLGRDVEGVSARDELAIPSACWGHFYQLSGGTGTDFNVCWYQGASQLSCSVAFGPENGLVPPGADRARIILSLGVRGTYTLGAAASGG